MATPRGRVQRVLVVLAGAAVALALGAGPAAAHDEIVGTSPADASTVAVAPDRVVLTFAEPAIALGTQVVVTGPGGVVVSQGAVTLDGSTVVQALAASRPAGKYSVDWRVTSADGHPVTGAFTFTATSPTGVATTPASTAAPTPSSTTLAVAPGTPVNDPAPTASGTNNRVAILILVLVVLALLVARVGRARSVRRLTAKRAAAASGTDDAGTGTDDAASGTDDAGTIGGA
jgi:hypothetical protein